MTPVSIRQAGPLDCGPAALATVAAHHGISVPLPAIRALVPIGGNGASLFGLQEAARKLGFEAEGVECTDRDPGSLPLPAILHIHFGSGVDHFVVLHSIEADRVVVSDPARGLLEWLPDELRSRWTGHALALAPPEDPGTVPGRLPLLRWPLPPALLRLAVVTGLPRAILWMLLGVLASLAFEAASDPSRSVLAATGMALVALAAFDLLARPRIV